ncbi:hypothetical protein T552_02025 [Pneumocystis carinii B80]|uniref:Uncharacterized protein n=1 Tax=Pneumocystis carinii (strain B80) TaxID=1408658 RepID=A0A0W4ZIF8_PNEC8|nr:hypothetical protein T552_02025 [Pneumocystis carinii B80]KTW28166.1 hypothetical protein T552_02025 [Pneumocystis carinii B80]
MVLLRNTPISKLKGVSEPTYISHEAALSVILSSITEFKDTSFTVSLNFSPQVLGLINEFLDYILFIFIKTSESIEISDLKNAILNELPTPLGVEAISEAEAELQTYIDNEPLEKKQNSKINKDISRNFVEIWKRVRVKCMVYSTLGNQEKDDFPVALWSDESISPSVSIYITSVLEFIAEYMLLVIGNACHRRLSETKNSYPFIEEIDLNEGFKYDQAILSLWNRWKSSDAFFDITANKNPFSASLIDTVTISPQENNKFKKEYDDSKENVENIEYETCINTESDNSNIEYLNLDNKETFFPAVLKGSSINTYSYEEILANQKNARNESFHNIELLEQDSSNEQENEYKAKVKQIEHIYKVNVEKNQQHLLSEKKSITSFNSEENVPVDSSVTFRSDIQNTVDNYTLEEVLNTTLSKGVLSKISPKDISKLSSGIPETASSFLEKSSTINNVDQDSVDPFNINTRQFIDILRENKNDFLTSEELFDKVRKLSLTCDQEKPIFRKEKSESHQFFIHNYNVNNTINHNFISSHKNYHSLNDEISPCYRILKSEQKEDCNSHGDHIDMKSEINTYTMNQNINETFSKNRNIFFHSTDSSLLLKTSLKTQINPSINKFKDDFLISEIPALDKYSETITLCQNANYLNSKPSQDEKNNKTRDNKVNSFKKLVDSNATMKMHLNPEGLREIDFDNEKSSLKTYSQMADVRNISDLYNTELISKYSNNVKESPTLDFIKEASIKHKQNKLQPREPTISKESTTSSLKEFLIETSMDKIREFSDSKLSTKHSRSSKTFDLVNSSDYASLSQVSSTSIIQKTLEKEDFSDKNKENSNRSYSRVCRREESLIEFLKSSERINTYPMRSQESISLDDDKNKVLYRKIQLYKDSSTRSSESNMFPKNSNYSGATRLIYVKDSPSKNPYQTPESIEKKKLSLDNMFSDSKDSFLDFNDKSIFFQNSLNDPNDLIIGSRTGQYPLKHISIKKPNIEYKESLTDFLKNTIPLNYIKKDSTNNSYASKKKKSTLFGWKKHELQKIKKACPENRYPTMKLK